MQELRLLGVHDDGDRLLLSDSNGEQYSLPLDEALRRAIARAAARPSAKDAPKASLSPRDIQARIRSGATAEEVAEESGLPLASVRRYEGPVLAEREHIAAQARGVEVPGHLDDGEGYRSAFGQDRAFLGEMVEHRLRQLGVAIASLNWDSHKTGHGQWEVVAYFDLPEGFTGRLGEEPPARWTYSPITRSLQNANRWAQHLSELEPLELHADNPWSSRRLSAVRDSPFDVEADAPEDADRSVRDAEGLLDLLNSRRGQRLGVDEEGDDALALLLTQGIPAAHPRPGGEETAEAEESRRLKLALPEREEPEDGLSLEDGISTHTREIRIVPPAPAPTPTPAEGPSLADEIFANSDTQEKPIPRQRSAMRGASFHKDPRDFERATAEREAREAREAQASEHEHKPVEKPAAKRRSIPSWDEIVFGTKGDG
ncbi:MULTISPECIES: septation protein SepH [Arthrobacter]|uniref:Septation protein SepH n=2 Tax=Arthrobacter TaxID=1663 RepID=A0ABU9KG30_9MICC|nr:septation protein SepH [Arthrobacter sp. YJM1]MDP5225850.1 septation protein SepH [Arthrobacter sp. YJM1]